MQASSPQTTYSFPLRTHRTDPKDQALATRQVGPKTAIRSTDDQKCCFITSLTHMFRPLISRTETPSQSINTQSPPEAQEPIHAHTFLRPPPESESLPKDKIEDYLIFIKELNKNKTATPPDEYYDTFHFIYDLKETVTMIGKFHYQITRNAQKNQRVVEPTNYENEKDKLLRSLDNLKTHFHQNMDILSQINLNEEKVFIATSFDDLYKAILSTEEITGESSVIDLPTWKMTDSEWNTLSDAVFKICKLLIKQHFTKPSLTIF